MYVNVVNFANILEKRLILLNVLLTLLRDIILLRRPRSLCCSPSFWQHTTFYFFAYRCSDSFIGSSSAAYIRESRAHFSAMCEAFSHGTPQRPRILTAGYYQK